MEFRWCMSWSLCCCRSVIVVLKVARLQVGWRGSGLEFGDMSATVPLTRQPQIEAALVLHRTCCCFASTTHTLSLTPHLTSLLSRLSCIRIPILTLLHSRATILTRRCFGEQTLPSPSSSPDACAERERRGGLKRVSCQEKGLSLAPRPLVTLPTSAFFLCPPLLHSY